MSEQLTETGSTENEAPEAEAVVIKTWTDSLAEVTDGSRVSDMGRVSEMVAELKDAATEAIRWATGLTEAVKRIAKGQAAVRADILTQDGNPDWAGTTQAYKAIAENVVTDSFEGLDKRERQNLVSRIRQHVNRTYRDIAIVAYVAAMTTEDGNPMFPGILDETGSVNPEAQGYDVFKARVRRQYIDAGLAIPSQWQTPQDKENGGGGGENNGGQDALSVLARGLEVVTEGKVADDYAAAFLLRGIGAFVSELANPRRDGGIKNREVVGAFLNRIATIAMIGEAACDMTLKPEGIKELGEARWDEAADKARLSREAQ